MILDEIKTLVEKRYRPWLPREDTEAWECCACLLGLVIRAEEFVAAVAPKTPPFTTPGHTFWLPGMKTPMEQRAEQWLEEVRGDRKEEAAT